MRAMQQWCAFHAMDYLALRSDPAVAFREGLQA